MEIHESRINNGYTISSVEKYLELTSNTLVRHYDELINDSEFLSQVSDAITANVNYKSNIPGLFKKIPIENVDWFGLNRILLYCLVREFKPQLILETGVYYGGNSAFILRALGKNDSGKLISIDFPQNKMESAALILRHPWVGESELYAAKYESGFIIPKYLKKYWEIVLSDSLEVLSKFENPVDMFVHDSEHTLEHVKSELTLIWDKISDNGLALIDDIDWSNGFYSFVSTNNLYPLLLTDNGKDNLRVRTGLIKKNHTYNKVLKITK
jgi:predicted O-methyltransferase YrrM